MEGEKDEIDKNVIYVTHENFHTHPHAHTFQLEAALQTIQIMEHQQKYEEINACRLKSLVASV